ncbi:LysR family transcriptional regulator [Allorhizobium borbori]|uniref:LysR family transcriptional regulator n=1 Tax=Allorhizobium borbori TaxID=485907 RepID=UPI00160850AA|nr:LysR family transcriptional regulator [Allorhizobium borbori]
MDTGDVLVFTTAVNAGSLAEAGRRLGLGPMVTSRRLANLEAELGVRLLHRTTRSLSLTPEGETFLPFAQALVDNEAEAVSRLRSDTRGASGLLRVSVPVSFGLKFVTPFIPTILDDNPELRISLDLTDSLPDLVATGTDLAIRIARLRDSNLIARKLSDNPRVLVASPSYLGERGTPALADELSQHSCLPLRSATHWTFIQDGKERHIRLNSRFTSSSIEGCHAISVAGGGIALLSWWNVADDIRQGKLVAVHLKDAEPEPLGIWAVYPTTRLVLPKVRVFISALETRLSQMPDIAPTRSRD